MLALGSLLVGVFFTILSFTAIYTSQAQLQLISLTDLDAQYICKSNFCLKVIKKGRTQKIVTTWRTFGSKDLVVLIRNSGKGRSTFNFFKHLNHDLIFSLLTVPASFVLHLSISAIKSTEVFWTNSLLHHLYPLRKMRHNCFGENSM